MMTAVMMMLVIRLLLTILLMPINLNLNRQWGDDDNDIELQLSFFAMMMLMMVGGWRGHRIRLGRQTHMRINMVVRMIAATPMTATLWLLMMTHPV